MTMSRPTLILFAGLLLFGCGNEQPAPAPAPAPSPAPTPVPVPAPVPNRMPSPGASPLRDAAHMMSFLSGATWRGVRDQQESVWRFDADGTFELTGPGACAIVGSDAGCDRVTGAWEADTSTLTLTGMTGGEAQAIGNGTVPLRWLDGKRLIEIGGVHHARQVGPQN